MFSNFKIFTRVLLFLGLFSISFASVSAAGSYAEGWALVKLVQFESRGVMFESFEGAIELTAFDEDEECIDEEDKCYKPGMERVEISVRPENAKTVNFLRKHLNQEILVRYCIHRFEAVALSSEFEITAAMLPMAGHVKALPARKAMDKTGGKRNFSVAGRIMRLEYEGTMVGTYEGLYFDKVSGLVHPFSVTEDEMAEHIWKVMQSSSGDYFLGISVAYVSGFRSSPYDIFEVNLQEAAGAVVIEPEPTEEPAENSNDDAATEETATEKPAPAADGETSSDKPEG